VFLFLFLFCFWSFWSWSCHDIGLVVDEMRSVTAWCAAVCCGTATVTTASSILAVFGKEEMMENARIRLSFAWWSLVADRSIVLAMTTWMGATRSSSSRKRHQL
jgi:hypothetical protein